MSCQVASAIVAPIGDPSRCRRAARSEPTMLVISTQQMQGFQQAARLRFEDEMMIHSRSFAPRLCEVIGDRQLRVAVRRAMDGAMRHGFTNRGPARLCVELIFLCGSAFDTDPQYP